MIKVFAKYSPYILQRDGRSDHIPIIMFNFQGPHFKKAL